MDLTILGTGNALVTECYHTCFVLSDKKQHFLVDGGGGSTILKHLKEANIHFNDIHDIFCHPQTYRSYYRASLDDPWYLSGNETGYLTLARPESTDTWM